MPWRGILLFGVTCFVFQYVCNFDNRQVINFEIISNIRKRKRLSQCIFFCFLFHTKLVLPNVCGSSARKTQISNFSIKIGTKYKELKCLCRLCRNFEQNLVFVLFFPFFLKKISVAARQKCPVCESFYLN